MNILLRDRCVHDGQKQQQHGDESSSESEAKKPFQALIIAPKSVLSHWEDELHKWITIDNDEDDEKNNEKFKFKIVVIKAKQGIPNIHDENDDGDGGDESSTSSSSSSSLSCVVYLINYEIVNKYRTEIDSFGKIDLLVCDECHYLKSVDTQRTQAVFGHHIHTESIKPISTERLWLVTGSPVLNNPSELFPLLNAIDLEKEIFPELESLDAFREQYCRKQVSPWGIYYKGGKNLSELRNRLSKVSTTAKRSTPIMIRRTKKEVLTELPDKRHQLFPLDDGGEASRLENNKLQEILQQLEAKDNKTGLKQEKEGIGTDITSITLFTTENLQKVKVVQLKDLLKVRDLHISGRKSELIQRLIEYEATSTTTKIDDTDVDEEEEKAINDEEITTIRNSALSALQSAPSENRSKVLSKILGFQTDSKTAVLGALMKARHQTALSKVPYAIELLEIATSSHKVVVFAHHRDVQDAIYDAFKDRAVVLNGDTSMEDRSIAVHRFQTDPSVTLFIGCK
jgi:SNF2 family DNA or RNA helicase